MSKLLLPNLIIGGAPKAGTSSLYHYLKAHPSICMSIPKEPYFFTANYSKGLTWYHSVFQEYQNQKIIGEASTKYLTQAVTTAPRIKKHLPNVKLIFILRNPVGRFMSDYWYAVKLGQIKHSQKRLKDLITGKNDMPSFWNQEMSFYNWFKKRGKYEEQLPLFYDRFPDHQIKVVFFEDLKLNQNAILQSIYRFLEIDQYESPATTIHNKTTYPSGAYATLPLLNKLKRALPSKLLNHIAPAKRKIIQLMYTERDTPKLDQTLIEFSRFAGAVSGRPRHS